ncbi:MAG: MarR family winged helix-turn-helix transcriptional regulator [Candidatus Korobacteraceae bacterium]
MKTPDLRESQTRKPSRSREEDVFLSLVRAAETLQRAVVELLKTADLSPAQYNVLRILRGAGKEGLACQKIGDRMITHDPDITRLLDRLEKRELIVRTRESADRRVITTRISPKGLKLLEPLDAPMVALHRRQLAHMNAGELDSLARLLDKAETQT